jgi:hypothetical protein
MFDVAALDSGASQIVAAGWERVRGWRRPELTGSLPSSKLTRTRVYLALTDFSSLIHRGWLLFWKRKFGARSRSPG